MQNTNKSNVLLVELIIAVLFFSLIAVTVTQTFVGSHHKSLLNSRSQRALIVAQDYVSVLAGADDPAVALMTEGFTARGDAFVMDGVQEEFRVEVQMRPEESSTAGKLVSASVQVYQSEPVGGQAEAPEQPLAELPVARYVPSKEAAQ